jgi:GNAT superfamily N-acetyltransferase
MTSVTVRPYVDGSTDSQPMPGAGANTRASHCVTEAFRTDPVCQAMFGSDYDKLFGNGNMIFVTDADKMVDVATVPAAGADGSAPDIIVGAALWERPTPTLTGWCRIGYLFLFVLFHGGIRRFIRVATMFLRLEALRHKHAPRALHLSLLGTAPASQGGGVGSRVIRAGLDRADEWGLPCYLESSNPRNLTFYKRQGFQVIDEVYPCRGFAGVAGAGPVVTLMARKPEKGSEK